MPGTFALPLAPSATAQHWRPITSRALYFPASRPTRKRKRHQEQDSSSSDAFLSSESPTEDETLKASSTNPLSLTPAEIMQYKLAGLELNQPLPGELVKDFPHRPLPKSYCPSSGQDSSRRSKRKSKSGATEPSPAKSKNVRKGEEHRGTKGPELGPGLQHQHLRVLVEMLQDCLRRGDMGRAKRAFGLLIRTEVAGHPIDLRDSGYWAIGAELLIRGFDGTKKNVLHEDGHLNSTFDGEENPGDAAAESGLPKRWGTKGGLEKAKDYYEWLIIQYPYDRQHPNRVSALDFWPAMVSVEIYGIQYDQRAALHRLAKEQEDDEGALRSDSDTEPGDEIADEDAGDDSVYAADQRRKARRLGRRMEKRWIKRDEVRETALEAAVKLAARLDTVMALPPYSDNHRMLRVRGMLALYIGDLSVPSMPNKENENWEGMAGSLRLGRGGRKVARDTEQRLLARQRIAEHERGKNSKRAEWERAKRLFDRVKREGGDMEGIQEIILD